MFNTISWQSYWTTLAIISTIYYFVIYLIYYRKNFKASFLAGTFTQNRKFSLVANTNDPGFEQPPKDSEEHIVYSCMEELNAFFQEAKKRKWTKNELISSLGIIIKKYPSIKLSAYRQPVLNVLSNHCEHVCSIHINEEELDHVWLAE
jgi:hypothetical protein